MGLILLVYHDAPIGMTFGERSASACDVVHLGDPDWSQVGRTSELLSVIVTADAALGPFPRDTLAMLATTDAPPIVVLSSPEATEEQRIALLDAGAAFCLPAPIGPRELGARIASLVARQDRARANGRRIYAVGDWLLDVTGRSLVRPGFARVAFTVREFDILSLLVECHGRVVSRAFIIDRIGQGRKRVDPRSVDVYVSRIRRALQTVGAAETFNVRAARSEGYICTPRSRPRLAHFAARSPVETTGSAPISGNAP